MAALEDRARRGSLLDDDQVHDFYDARLPDDIVSTRQFDRWWRDARDVDSTQLDLTAAVLRTTDGVAISFTDFPDEWTVSDDLSLPLRYRFEPGRPLDGVTVTIPLLALNQVPDDGFDWHVPGFRRELAAALARTLPKELRRALIPATDTVAAAFERVGPPQGRFVDALAAALSAEAGVTIRADDFAPAALAGYLRPHLVVVDESGAVLDAGGDTAVIRQRLATATRQAIAGAVPLRERRGLVTWDVGTLPPVVSTTHAGVPVRGYPALLDDDDSVSLRILTNADLQRRVMRGGVRRLLLLAGAVPTAASRVQLSNDDQLALAAASTTAGALATECAAIAIDEVLDEHDLPWDADAFATLRRVVGERAGPAASRCLRTAVDALVAARRVRSMLARLVAPAVRASVIDATDQLDRLVGAGFVQRTGAARLADVVRYVRGIEHRLERLPDDIPRDMRRMAEVRPLEARCLEAEARHRRPPPDLVAVRWQLEELRMSIFAQSLGVSGPVSPRRIAQTLDAL